MADYNKQILNTIGLVTESALSKHTGFDKTLVATVIDASRAESKNYRLQYNEITFDAYSIVDEQYRANDQVYFTVPSGDWNARKIILGKYEVTGKKGAVYKQPFSNMIKASSNLNNSTELTLRITPAQETSSGEQQEIGMSDEFLRYGGLRKTEEFGEFDYIGLAFVVKGATFEPSNTSGSYGVLVNLKLNDSTEFTNYTIFDSSQFFGNPYWCDGMRQELLIEYPKGSEVKDIQLQVYQDGNFNDITNVSEIAFTDLEVYFGYSISKFSQGKLVQYIPSNRSLQYSFKENGKVEVCPVYYALYHDGKIYDNKLKVGSPAGELELKWYKFQSGAAGTELSGANYVDLQQSELNDGWRINLVDQSEIRIKMVAYPTNAEKPLYEHVLNFNNTDKVITAEEEAQIAQSQQGDFQVKTYRSDDTAKFNATKFYAYDNTDNRLVSNFEIGLEIIPNDKIMKLTKGTITYNILSSIPRIKENEEGEKKLDGVLATQLSYFVNKTYKKDITSKNENDEDVIETKTFSYWTPLDADGDVIYKTDSDQYDFSNAATITCNYDYTPEDEGSRVTIPAAAVKLQNYLYPYRDNRIECIISQDGKSYKKIVDIDFDISNTAGTGYSLVVSPAPGEFEYGMQIANYLYSDPKNKTYKLRAQLFDQNHELIKGDIYSKINWNIENPNGNIIDQIQKDDPNTNEITTGYCNDVSFDEKNSILTIHIKDIISMITKHEAENFMIVTATISNWTSSDNVKVNLKTKYPLATFGCFNALYYNSENYNTNDERLKDYKYSNDLLTQFTYVCPSRIYYNPFGELITNYKATDLKVLPTKGEQEFSVLLKELKNIINTNGKASIGEVKLGWVLNFEDKNIPLSISHEIDFEKSEDGEYYISFTNSNYNKAKLAIQQLLMSNNNIKASIGLVIHYTRTDSEVRPYYLFQQPLLIERSHNTSEVLNSWDGNSIKLDDDNDVVLSTAMVAGEKDSEGKFTGVMIGSLGTIGVDGISAKGSSGIYGFKGSNNRFYLNNNAEFFVGDEDRFIKFGDKAILEGYDESDKPIYKNGLNISLSSKDRFLLSQDNENKIGMDETGIYINNFQFENGQLVATGNIVSNSFMELMNDIETNKEEITKYEIYINTSASSIVWELMETATDTSELFQYFSQAVLKCAIGSSNGVGIKAYRNSTAIINKAFYGTIHSDDTYPFLDLDLDGNGYVDSTDARLLLEYKEGVAKRVITVSINPTLSSTSKGFIQVENEIGGQIFSIGTEGLRTIYGKFIKSIVIGEEKDLNENAFNNQKLTVNGNGYFNGSVKATSFDNNSDPFIKTNVISTETNNALSLVNNLKFYDYNLKSNGSAIKLGLMSTEAPEAILGEDKKSINIYSYCGLLAKAVQELSNKLREKGVLD